MRIVVVGIAALLTLGLAGFSVIVAQKATDPISLTAAGAPGSSSQNTAEAAKTDKVAPHLVEVTDVAAPLASTIVAQNNTIAITPAFPDPTPAPVAACNNPDAPGLSRVIEINTTGGPAFGTEHFKQYDFLRDKEVVLTFDDGPWPGNTPMVLKALLDNCTKATFFEMANTQLGAPIWPKHSPPPE